MVSDASYDALNSSAPTNEHGTPPPDIEALLPLVDELEAFDLLASDWDTDRLAFQASHTNCPTLSELDSFVALRQRLGESAFEDPTFGGISAHVGDCTPCTARVSVLRETPRERSQPLAPPPARIAPAHWRIAASFLGLAALWFTFSSPATINSPLLVAGPSSITLEAGSLVQDIVHFYGERRDDGSRIDRIEIAMENDQEIVVFLKGWNKNCTCVEWQRCEVRPGEMGYVVDIDVTDHPNVDQTILVLASDDMLVEDTLCCFRDSDDADPIDDALDSLYALPGCLEEDRVLAFHDFKIR